MSKSSPLELACPPGHVPVGVHAAAHHLWGSSARCLLTFIQVAPPQGSEPCPGASLPTPRGAGDSDLLREYLLMLGIVLGADDAAGNLMISWPPRADLLGARGEPLPQTSPKALASREPSGWALHWGMVSGGTWGCMDEARAPYFPTSSHGRWEAAEDTDPGPWKGLWVLQPVCSRLQWVFCNAHHPTRQIQSVLPHGAYLTSEMLARVVLRLHETQNSGDGVLGEPQLFLPLLCWPARFQAAVVPECVGPQL